ncbi:Pycsar system effector family protein [Streptomyces sp. JNUCC 64]
MTSTPSRVDAALSDGLLEVRAEIARTDTKASLLLGFSGVLVGLSTSTGRGGLPVVAVVMETVGVGCLLASALLALWVVRPVLPRAAVSGFPCWARLNPAQLRAYLSVDQRVQDLAALSRIAWAKSLRLRRAVHLAAVGGVLVALAAGIPGAGGGAG